MTTDWTQCRARSPEGTYCAVALQTVPCEGYCSCDSYFGVAEGEVCKVVTSIGHEGQHKDKWGFSWTVSPSA